MPPYYHRILTTLKYKGAFYKFFSRYVYAQKHNEGIDQVASDILAFYKLNTLILD